MDQVLIKQSTHTAKKLWTISLFSSTLKGSVHKRLIKITQQECERKRRIKIAMGRDRTWLWMLVCCSTDCCVQLIPSKNRPFFTFYHLSWKTVNWESNWLYSTLISACCIFSDNFKFSLGLRKPHKVCKAYTNVCLDLFPLNVQFFSPRKHRKSARRTTQRDTY